MRGEINPDAYIKEEATRAKMIEELVAARKALDADTTGRYIVSVNSASEFSQSHIVGVAPVTSGTVASKHPLERSDIKYVQYKDRVAGGEGVPLESSKGERDTAYFLDQFAKGHLEVTHPDTLSNGVSNGDSNGDGSSPLVNRPCPPYPPYLRPTGPTPDSLAGGGDSRF